MILVLAVILVLSITATLLWFLRGRQRHEPEATSVSRRSSAVATLLQADVDRTLVEPTFNPLQGLSFEDSLDGEKFAINVQRTTEVALAESAKASGFQLGNLSIQMMSASRDGFVVTFEKGTAEFVKAANGAYKAQTRGPKGAFQEIGNIDQLGTWAHRAASIASITVATANLISNADGSRKLGQLLDGQDRVFAYRAIDQCGALKTAYEELREELSRSAPRTDVIDGIRHRIREIRHVLMDEAKRDLGQLKSLYPQRKGFLKKPRKAAGDWYKRKLSGAEDERQAELNEFRGKLLLARHCLKYEDIAATASGANERQALLLSEAHHHLQQLLPQYKELESELQTVPDVGVVLESMFEAGKES